MDPLVKLSHMLILDRGEREFSVLETIQPFAGRGGTIAVLVEGLC